MLDITQLLSTVPHLSGIYVIGVDNECKELLLHLNLKSTPIHSDDITISTLNFDNKSYAPQTLSFNFRECRHFTVNYNTGDILQYLYDPNCCIMKSGAFPVIAKKYPQLLKLGKNAHLFTCDTFFPEFPGRRSARLFHSKKNTSNNFTSDIPKPISPLAILRLRHMKSRKN